VLYRADELLTLASTLLERAGLPRDRAQSVGEVLVEGDLLGRTTHGLALLPEYLRELDAGRMALTGEPEVISDLGAAITWDGRRLPGPWLVRQAITKARGRMPAHPVVTVVIRRSNHIGALQAYLKPVTDAGLMILLTCSDPSTAIVAPHGGVAPRFTPNPLAAGIPTKSDPVLIDISMSTTSNRTIRRAAQQKQRLPGKWLIGADGAATDDAESYVNGTAAMLPLGGLDLGYKGFALMLLVEALTGGLSGHGRADRPTDWEASVFLQLIDPDGFGGRDSFVREMQHIVETCRDTPVAPGQPRVHVPGEAALARRRRQLSQGVDLHDTIVSGLVPWLHRYAVSAPTPV
jgi:LDH2 family malate/lactate/ureidoglycolate dehydrogenase